MLDSSKEFQKYATKHMGISSATLHNYSSAYGNYINPTITEQVDERHRYVVQDVFSRLMRERIIFLGVPINDYVANIIQAQLLFLDSTGEKKDLIEIYLNSPGGQVYAGLGIYDTMQWVASPISVICTGMAASMGAVLLCAGTKGERYALKHSRVMIHQPLGGTQGQASDIQIAAREIEKLKRELYEIIAHHSNKTYDEVCKDGDRDFWMTTDEALKYGMIDKILQPGSK